MLEDGRRWAPPFIWVGMFMNLMIYFFLQKWLTSLLVQVGIVATDRDHGDDSGIGGRHRRGLHHRAADGPVRPLYGGVGTLRPVGGFGGGHGAGASNRRNAGRYHLGSLAVGFCLSGGQKANNALSVYFYPTALRGTGLGWSLGIGRIGGVFGPLRGPTPHHGLDPGRSVLCLCRADADRRGRDLCHGPGLRPARHRR